MAPHGRDMDDCQALGGDDYAPTTCPSSRSPDAWRRGAITHHLTEDVPVDMVSNRMNVSRDVLEAHYDRLDEEVNLLLLRGTTEQTWMSLAMGSLVTNQQNHLQSR